MLRSPASSSVSVRTSPDQRDLRLRRFAAGTGSSSCQSRARACSPRRRLLYRPRASYAGFWIREVRRPRRAGLDVRAHRSITDRVAPVDQPLLSQRRGLLKPGRGAGELQRRGVRTWQRVRQAVVGDVGSDSPVRSLPHAELGALDRLPLPQCPYLAIDDVEDALALVKPIELRPWLCPNVATAIADQDRLVALPGCLKAEVVVDAAVT